jgi:hypothetical protein
MATKDYKDYIRVQDALFVVRELIERAIPEREKDDLKMLLTAWNVIEDLEHDFNEMPIEEKKNFKLF